MAAIVLLVGAVIIRDLGINGTPPPPLQELQQQVRDCANAVPSPAFENVTLELAELFGKYATNDALPASAARMAGAIAAFRRHEGGPTAEEPHGIINPGDDVYILGVDGKRTSTRNFSVRVHPGERILRLRVQYPIANDSNKPQEKVDKTLNVEDGVEYRIDRIGESEFPPYELKVTERRFRE